MFGSLSSALSNYRLHSDDGDDRMRGQVPNQSGENVFAS